MSQLFQSIIPPYIPVHNRVYLVDKDVNIYVVEYQTAVLRGDMDATTEILPSVPKDQVKKVPCLLEGRGLFALTGTSVTFYQIIQISRISLSKSRPTPITNSTLHFLWTILTLHWKLFAWCWNMTLTSSGRHWAVERSPYGHSIWRGSCSFLPVMHRV